VKNINTKFFLLILILLLISFYVIGYSSSNSAPIIKSEPIITVKEGTIYTYTIKALDPESDVLSYSLDTHPSGMTIHPTTGMINWKPSTPGNYHVTVKVFDGNNFETQSFIVVVEKVLLTSLTALPSYLEIARGETKKITSVTAHYDNGTTSVINLADCIYRSSNPNVIVNGGVISVPSSCTYKNAFITISYTDNRVTRSDSVNVVAPKLYCGG